MKRFKLAILVVALAVMTTIPIHRSVASEIQNQILFKNVNVFDGLNNSLAKGMNVLVIGNKIEKVSRKAIEVDDSAVV